MANGAVTFRRLEITAGFAVLCATAFIISPSSLIVVFIAAAAVHELGHVAAVLYFGGTVYRFRLSVIGAEMRANLALFSYQKELAVYLAGPLFGLMTAVVFALAARLLQSEQLYIFAGANAVLSAFNLLPARQLDGGNCVRVISLKLCGRVTVVVAAMHYIAIAAITAVGIFACVYGGFNLSLFIIAVFLLVGGKSG